MEKEETGGDNRSRRRRWNKSLKQCLTPLILYIMLKQNLDTRTKLGIS